MCIYRYTYFWIWIRVFLYAVEQCLNVFIVLNSMYMQTWEDH